jgi:hypothetical protein
MIDRVSDTITQWGVDQDYFSDDEEIKFIQSNNINTAKLKYSS